MICKASLDIVAEMAHAKGLAVDFEMEPASIELMTDARRLSQLLVNLLGNATKFTPEHGAIGLRVIGDDADGKVRLVVWDTGIGINPEDQQRIFDPFVQVDSSLTRQHAGTGLGLAMVSRIVALHGGQIKLRSAPGAGSEFTAILPWRKPPRKS
jgi:signal transduction histidine kinase